jgi:hypothetical protein
MVLGSFSTVRYWLKESYIPFCRKSEKNLALRHITRIFSGLGVTDMVSDPVVFSFKLDEVIDYVLMPGVVGK